MDVCVVTDVARSRECLLPEIVVDHQRPDDGLTSVDYSTGSGVTLRQTSTQMTDDDGDDDASPTNDYDYVLHKIHHQQQQQQPPPQPGPASPRSVKARTERRDRTERN